MIKERAARKREEEKVLEESSLSLSLDGKPEMFPFKNIKPKKAYLLGGGASPSKENNKEEMNFDETHPMMFSNRE